jgi:hypothetical protein
MVRAVDVLPVLENVRTPAEEPSRATFGTVAETVTAGSEDEGAA